MAGRQPLLTLMRLWRRRQRSFHCRWQALLLLLLLAWGTLILLGQRLIDDAVAAEDAVFVAAAGRPLLGAIDYAAEQLQRRGEGWLQWELSNDWRHQRQIDREQLAAIAVDQLWLWQGEQLLANVGAGTAAACRLPLLQSLRADARQPQPPRRGVLACEGRWWLFVLMTISSDDGQRWVAAVTRPLLGSRLRDNRHESGMDVAMLAPLLQRLLRRSFNQLALMSEQQRFSAQVVEAIRDLILITDSDGVVRHLNPAARDFLGLGARRDDAVVGISLDLLLLVDAGITTSLSHAVGRALAAGHTFSSAIVLRPRNAPRQQVSGRMVIYPMNALRGGSGAVVLIALSDSVCLLEPQVGANPAGAAATGR